MPSRSRRSPFSLAVGLCLVLGPTIARPSPTGPDRVLGPDAEPVIRQIFKAVQDCRVDGIAIQGGVIEATLSPRSGERCRMLLVAPGEPAEPLPRIPGSAADLLHQDTCPQSCVDQALQGLASVKSDLRFLEAGSGSSARPGISNPSGPAAGISNQGGPWVCALSPGASVALSAFLGLVLVAFLAWGLPRVLRALRSQDHGWVLLALLFGMGLVLFGEAWTAPLRSGDEWINHSYVLAGLWNGLHLGHYPHPALSFEVLSALYGLWAAVHAVVTGQGLLEASLDLAIRQPFGQILLARGVSVLCWLGVIGVVWSLAARTGRAWWAGLLAALVVFRGESLYPTTLSPYPLGILLAVLSLDLSWRMERAPSNRQVVLSALCTGAAIGTHYLAVLLAPLALLAFWMLPGTFSRKVRLSLRWALLVAVGFWATNPHLWSDLPEYLHFWQYRAEELRVFDPNNAWQRPADPRALSPLFYWELLGARDLRGAMAAGSLVFLFLGLHRRDLRFLLPVLWGVLPAFLLSLVATRYEHYLQFLLPGAAVLGFAWLPWWMPSSLGPAVRTPLVLAVAGMLAGVPFLGQPPISGLGRGLRWADPYGEAVRLVGRQPGLRGDILVGGLPLDVVLPVLETRGTAGQIGALAAAMIRQDAGVGVSWGDPRRRPMNQPGKGAWRDAGVGVSWGDPRRRPMNQPGKGAWVTIGEVTAVPGPPVEGLVLRDWIQQGGLEVRLWMPREGAP